MSWLTWGIVYAVTFFGALAVFHHIDHTQVVSNYTSTEC